MENWHQVSLIAAICAPCWMNTYIQIDTAVFTSLFTEHQIECRKEPGHSTSYSRS